MDKQDYYTPSQVAKFLGMKRVADVATCARKLEDTEGHVFKRDGKKRLYTPSDIEAVARVANKEFDINAFLAQQKDVTTSKAVLGLVELYDRLSDAEKSQFVSIMGQRIRLAPL